MDPAVPVSEMDRRNVTLFCDVRDGNPAALVSVRWYFDGELLKQVRPYATNEVASHSIYIAKRVQEVDHSNESDNETIFTEKSSDIIAVSFTNHHEFFPDMN